MRAPRAKKPTSVDETLRTLRVFEWLIEGLRARGYPLAAPPEAIIATLSVAERIAARTDDGDPA